MIGAIIGDIVGSRFEFNNYRAKDFELFTGDCFFTDDSIMSLAIGKALLEAQGESDATLEAKSIHYMQLIGRPYPNCGYGGRFYDWMYTDNPKPYNSFGNGAAMRVSACAYVAQSLEQALHFSDIVTAVSHNHEEGLKGARATTAAIYMALQGASMAEIKEHIVNNYYALDFTIDEIRESYYFNETCQETVPQALEAFFESSSFEDALRIAISVGGDSDTLAAITCSVAEAFYGVPQVIRTQAESYLDDRLLTVLRDFESQYPSKEW